MKKYIFGLMTAAALAGCSNDEIVTAPVDGQSVINASFEGGVKSRVGFTNDNAVFFWNAKDAISVHTTYTSNPFATYTLSTGAGTNSAQFNGNLVGEGTTTSVCALYPANTNHKVNGNTLTFHMSDAYTYNYSDDSFGLLNDGASNSTNAPMLAKISTNGSTDLSFKHLGGVFCFQIAKIPATATKFVFTANSKITGDFTADLNAADPSISTTSSEPATDNTVTINFTAGVEKRVFYIPVPTGTYAGFKWEMQDGSNAVLASFESSAENKVERTYLVRMPLLTCSTVTGGITQSVADVSGLNTLLKGENTGSTGSTVLPTSVTVTAATNISTAIEIPAAITAPETTANPGVLNLTFNEVPTASSNDKAIEIEDASTSTTTPTPSEESKSSIEIAIPEVKDGATAPSFDINLSSSTVTLAAAEETTTYNKVTATTAANTLVVGKGVTVNELIVKGGNVKVMNGGTISKITRESGNTSTVIIYKEEGASVPTNLGSEFSVVDAAVADLQNVAKKGGEYTLAADMTGDFVISATAEVSINLNGHKITNKSGDTFTVNKDSKLTINGNGTVDNVTHQKACIYNNGTVVLNGGTYTRSKEASVGTTSSNGNSFYNILNHGTMTIQPGVVVTSTGAFSSLIDNGYYDYTKTDPRIAYVSGTNQANPSLTINGGTFSGGINTIKNDDGASLTIVDGTFTNTTQATVQNNHLSEIKGGVFKPTSSASHVVESKALATNGVNLGQTTISGGTFLGNLYLHNGTNANTASFNISGGTFSDPSAVSYMSADAKVTVQLAADTKLAKTISVEKGTATIDLNQHTLTAANTATVVISKNNKVAAIAVKDGAKATVKNGKVGDDTTNLSYGVYAYGKADVTLDNVQFGNMVTFAYNGTGKLTATGCTFQGWLSGWHQGGTFTDCTFTIGKAYYSAAICYGSTTFTGCKFFKNNVDADAYDDSGKPDNDGYYRCCSVVSQKNPSNSVSFSSCKFINENGTDNGNVLVSDHPFHACGWGDGTTKNYDIKVDGSAVTSYCSDYTKAHSSSAQ